MRTAAPLLPGSSGCVVCERSGQASPPSIPIDRFPSPRRPRHAQYNAHARAASTGRPSRKQHVPRGGRGRGKEGAHAGCRQGHTRRHHGYRDAPHDFLSVSYCGAGVGYDGDESERQPGPSEARIDRLTNRPLRPFRPERPPRGRPSVLTGCARFDRVRRDHARRAWQSPSPKVAAGRGSPCWGWGARPALVLSSEMCEEGGT